MLAFSEKEANLKSPPFCFALKSLDFQDIIDQPNQRC